MAPDVAPDMVAGEAISSSMVAALESAWAVIRSRHRELPAVVVILGSGTLGTAATRLGHFASLRWSHLPDPDTRSSPPAGPAGPEGAERPALHELFIAGEGLDRGAADVLATLLHEAAHCLAFVRDIQDTSRGGRYHNTRFRALAAELGIEVEQDPTYGWSTTTLPPSTLHSYTGVIDRLGSVLRLRRTAEPHGASTGKPAATPPVSAWCDCGRKIRVTRRMFDLGPILCGECDTPFTELDS